jgi:hypothetical protein
MKSTTRIIAGLLFAATLAISLLASGGDADAKTHGGSSRLASGDLEVTIVVPSPLPSLFVILGVTWE